MQHGVPQLACVVLLQLLCASCSVEGEPFAKSLWLLLALLLDWSFSDCTVRKFSSMVMTLR